MKKKTGLSALCLSCAAAALAGCVTNDKIECENTCADDMTIAVCGDPEATVKCAAGCFEGACRICAEGAKKCEFGTAYVCSGNAWTELSRCADGCDGFACKGECADGAQTCNDNAQYVCADAKWNKTADCANGCDGDACASCADGSRKCDFDAEILCVGGKWQLAQTCSLGCGAAGSCLNCQNDAVKCENDAIYSCAGDAWKETQSCPFGCLNATECRVCAEGAQKCENNAQYICDHNAWRIQTECALGCGAKTCRADGNQNHMIDDFETAPDQGKPCRSYADCSEFCDSVAGYVCSTRCTADSQCESGYACRPDGRCALEAFVTVWQIPADNREISFPIASASDCDFSIDWGDGTAKETRTSCPDALKHVYVKAGAYRVKITGKLRNWTLCKDLTVKDGVASCSQSACSPEMTSIESFGPVGLGKAVFGNCPTPIAFPLADVPDASLLTDMSGYFFKFGAGAAIGLWDTHSVVSMAGAFERSPFDSDISHWDVSNAKNMSKMFYAASKFNGDISLWDVSGVTDMSKMFFAARRFNGDISKWNTKNVTSMNGMFQSAMSFAGDVSQWDTSRVTDMSHMFSYASKFNSELNWNTSFVKNMTGMFEYAVLFAGDVSQWDTSRVTDMSHMFSYASKFNSDLNNWNTSSVTDMSYMFYYASKFNRDLNNWNTSSVTDMSGMFLGAASFDGEVPFSVQNVKNMSYMFAGAKKFNKNIGGWNVSGVEKMYGMFSGATAFNQDIGRWNVSNVSNMTEMFFQAASFDQDLSGWTLNAVKDSREIFNIFGESGLKKENYCKIITNSVFLQFDEVLGLGYACSSEAAEPEA